MQFMFSYTCETTCWPILMVENAEHLICSKFHGYIFYLKHEDEDSYSCCTIAQLRLKYNTLASCFLTKAVVRIVGHCRISIYSLSLKCNLIVVYQQHKPSRQWPDRYYLARANKYYNRSSEDRSIRNQNSQASGEC